MQAPRALLTGRSCHSAIAALTLVNIHRNCPRDRTNQLRTQSCNPKPLDTVSDSPGLICTLPLYHRHAFLILFSAQLSIFFFLNNPAPPEIFPFPLPDALPI